MFYIHSVQRQGLFRTFPYSLLRVPRKPAANASLCLLKFRFSPFVKILNKLEITKPYHQQVIFFFNLLVYVLSRPGMGSSSRLHVGFCMVLWNEMKYFYGENKISIVI